MNTWINDQYGSNKTLTLTKGVDLYVSKSMTRGEGYYWTALGRKSKPVFATCQEAEEAVIKYARKALSAALESLN
jgi:hypothetical protein